MNIITDNLIEIKKILQYNYTNWPLRCSLSTKEIKRIYDLTSTLESFLFEKKEKLWNVSYYPSEWGGYDWDIQPTALSSYFPLNKVSWGTRWHKKFYNVSIEHPNKDTALKLGKLLVEEYLKIEDAH